MGETYVEKSCIFDSERVELLRTTRFHVENAQRTEDCVKGCAVGARQADSHERRTSRACRREERNWIFAIGTAGTITQTCFPPSDQGGRGKRGEMLRWREGAMLFSLDVAFCPSPNPTHATPRYVHSAPLCSQDDRRRPATRPTASHFLPSASSRLNNSFCSLGGVNIATLSLFPSTLPRLLFDT